MKERRDAMREERRDAMREERRDEMKEMKEKHIFHLANLLLYTEIVLEYL